MSRTTSTIRIAASFTAAIALMANCSPAVEPDVKDKAPIERSHSTTGEITPEGSKAHSLSGNSANAIAKMEQAIAEAKKTSGPGSPAIWTLADDDTTVHIFGTVHILKPDTEWRTDAFNQAFNAADKLVLEIAMETPEDQQAVVRTMMSASIFNDGRQLTDVLNKDEMKIVGDAASGLGIPAAALRVQEPWAAALTMMNAQMMKDGFDPESGVETVLTKAGKTQGKSFQSLETPEFQIGVFDNLSMEVQIEMLVEGASTLNLNDSFLSSLVDEWADGDVNGLGLIAANPEAAGSEEFYDALFVERNKNWVPQIEALLDEPGTIMVAVGAGHLAGPDSVITLLENNGHTLTRTQ